MKNKVLLISIIVIIVVAVVLAIILLSNKKEVPEGIEITKIEYSTGGGFGTQASTASKIITVTSDGKVVFSNDYDDFTKSTTITEKEYKELHDFIYERLSLFDEKVKSTDAMDGGSQYLTIEFISGKKLEFGGYMVANKKFEEIEEKIYDSSFYEEFSKYRQEYNARNR